jgi:peptidyl-prolyl cis-trans isomerase SurA
MFAAQKKLNPDDPGLKTQMLNSMIDEKLLLAQAKLDSVVVSDDEVKRRLDYQIDLFVQQYGSREKVEQMYGMSIEKIKRELSEDVRKNLMAQTLQQKKFGQVDVTRHEVEDFFQTYKDSLGLIPEKYTMAHIFMNPKASEKVKSKARMFAQSILDSIKLGADFAAMAKKYSEDPGTAANGGDLGFTKRGRLVPEYESAAFALQPGELSGVVESPFGFHIIQLIDKKGETVHTRHILIKIKNDEDTDLKTIEALSDLRDSILSNKGTFESYAKRFSNDKANAKLGGLLGTFETNQIDSKMLEVVRKMKTGDISYPSRIELGQGIYGYHIIKLIEKKPEHKPNIEKDFEEIKQLAIYKKQEKLYSAWIQELKEKIYWEIKI